jgi:protein-S-isoprenylcysteine O-methyltransferase Ste14
MYASALLYLGLLATDLPGYRDYQVRVRYRLIPYLW